jgi:anti-sigma-K factor RskA
VNEHREEHLDLCAGYALGSLDAADRQRLEAHLAEGCPMCQRALADSSLGVVMLAASAPPATPDPALRARVLAAVHATPQTTSREAKSAPPPALDELSDAPPRGRAIEMRPRRPSVGFGWMWAAAAAALAVATATSWNAAGRLRAELGTTRGLLVQAQRELEEERRWAAVTNAPDARVAELAITPAGIAALRARATYDPHTRSAVLVFENFSAPPGRDYQLWALRGAGVASLGLIKPDASGRAILRLENVGDPNELAGFAVSLERTGGSPNSAAPTGPVVMAGKFRA